VLTRAPHLQATPLTGPDRCSTVGDAPAPADLWCVRRVAPALDARGSGRRRIRGPSSVPAVSGGLPGWGSTTGQRSRAS